MRSVFVIAFPSVCTTPALLVHCLGPRVVAVRGVALDPKHKSVIVSDKRLNALVTYACPEVF